MAALQSYNKFFNIVFWKFFFCTQPEHTIAKPGNIKETNENWKEQRDNVQY